MSWQRWLSSPPPAAVWVVDRDLVGVVRRGQGGALECRSARPDDTLAEVGPVGLQGVDGARLGRTMARALDGAVTTRRAAAIVPTSWCRCYLFDFDRLPRRPAEVTDILRWRLKKLLPVPPGELRLAWTLTSHERSRRVLCVASLDKPMAALEAAFTAAGVSLGLITCHLLALAAAFRPGDGRRLVVQHEAGFQSLLLIVDGIPTLVRTKPLAATAAGAKCEIDTAELRLTASYIRTTLAVAGPIRVSVAAESSDAGRELREWWAAQEGMVVDHHPTAAVALGSDDRVGSSRLAAAASLLEGSGW